MSEDVATGLGPPLSSNPEGDDAAVDRACKEALIFEESLEEVLQLVSQTYRITRQINTRHTLPNFTLFDLLPPELRLKIWRTSFPGPRTVELRYDTVTNHCVSPSETPLALSINSESRQETLKYYKLSFATKYAPAKIYFNFDIDTLYFGIGNFSPLPVRLEDYIFDVLDTKDVSRVRNVAVDSNTLWLHPHKDPQVPSVFTRHLKGVKTFTTIVASDCKIDIVLNRTRANEWQLGVWSISDNGAATPFDIRPEEVEDGEEPLSYPLSVWHLFEGALKHNHINASVIRIVSRSTMAREPQFAKRMAFLDATIYNPTVGCLYRKDGLIEKLLAAKVKAESGNWQAAADWWDYTAVCCMNLPRRSDPTLIYAHQNSCACPVHHGIFTGLPGIRPVNWSIDFSEVILWDFPLR